MTPFSNLVYATDDITLSEANDMIWDINSTLYDSRRPQRLKFIVFRKDYDTHKEHSLECSMFPSAISSEQESIHATLLTGYLPWSKRSDLLCIDSSDGFTNGAQNH